MTIHDPSVNQGYEMLKRRREIARAMQERSMQPYQQQMVSGRVVPYNIGDAIGTLSSAYFGRKGEEKAQAGIEAGTKSAVERMTELLQGGGRGVESETIAGPPLPTKPDPQAAQMFGATNEFLSGNKAVQAALMAQNKAKSGGGSPYYTTAYGREGTVLTNVRTGEQEYKPYPKGFKGRDRFDPGLQADISGQREKQVQIQKSAFEPEREALTEKLKLIEKGKAQPQIEFDKAMSKAMGEATAKAQIDLPTTEITAAGTLTLVDELLNHPGFKDAVGFWDNPAVLGGYMPWTEAAGFRKRLEQLEGRTFMNIFPTLKGGGQITEIEGEKGQMSINRMATATNEAEFILAASDFKVEIVRLRQLVRDRVNQPQANQGGGYDDEKERRYQEWKANQ